MNPRVPISVTSSPEKLPSKLEAQILAATARILRTGFPNAERTDCPSREALQALARKAASDVESQIVTDHLTCCSPCFAEYERLMRRERIWRNTKLLALCASVIITVGLAVWFYAFRVGPDRRTPEPTVVQKEPVPRQAIPNEFEIAVLDLRNQSPVRGDQPPTPSTDVPSLPARRLALSVYLPIGSEVGEYEMQILRETETPLVSQDGTAKLENENVVVHVRADLTRLASGRYLLRLRRASYSWRYYPVVLTP